MNLLKHLAKLMNETLPDSASSFAESAIPTNAVLEIPYKDSDY